MPHYFHSGEIADVPAIVKSPITQKHYLVVPPAFRALGERIECEPGSVIVPMPEMGLYVCPPKDPRNPKMPGSVWIPDTIPPHVVKGIAGDRLLTEDEAMAKGIIKRVEVAPPDEGVESAPQKKNK